MSFWDLKDLYLGSLCMTNYPPPLLCYEKIDGIQQGCPSVHMHWPLHPPLQKSSSDAPEYYYHNNYNYHHHHHHHHHHCHHHHQNTRACRHAHTYSSIMSMLILLHVGYKMYRAHAAARCSEVFFYKLNRGLTVNSRFSTNSRFCTLTDVPHGTTAQLDGQKAID